MKKLSIQYVTADNFRDFGQVITIPTEGSLVPTTESEFHKFYGGLGFMTLREVMEFGVCTFKKRDLIVNQMEQHAQTQELLFAIDGDFIMPVAPILTQNGEAFPGTGKIIAIRVHQGEGVIFNHGIWHWAPFPLKETSSVIVGFEKDTAHNDITIRDLEEKIIMVGEG
ncbi:hypothetical protein ES702_03719 [subsurface metagenome]